MIRPASAADMEAVYRMGYDAWSDFKPLPEYLVACSLSNKYRAGTWYVLEEKGRLASSLIVYRFPRRVFGLGSIATPPAERGRGHASALIAGVLDRLDAEPAESVYLHSDIRPGFYERFGFRALPPALQRRPKSTCMIRCPSRRFQALVSDPGYRAPDYF